MKRLIALLLIAILVLSVAGCSFSFGNVDDPGEDPGEGPGEDPGQNPGLDSGQWRTVEGEFYTFSETDLCFAVAFRELHFTHSDNVFGTSTFKAQ